MLTFRQLQASFLVTHFSPLAVSHMRMTVFLGAIPCFSTLSSSWLVDRAEAAALPALYVESQFTTGQQGAENSMTELMNDGRAFVFILKSIARA